MAYEPVGGQWLLEHFKLFPYHLTHRSFMGARAKELKAEDGSTEVYYQR